VFACSRPECEETGERWKSQIRNPARLYCSRSCKSLDEGRFTSGIQNPNFKHGRYVEPTCDCGQSKDERSEKCALCAKRSFRRGGKRTVAEALTVGAKRDKYIRRLILKHNIIPYVCGGCGLVDSWQGEPLVLELDHINGDPADNRVENLRFLCPNCHSQTETFASRNKGWHNQRRVVE
jgi:hypothetical protein